MCYKDKPSVPLVVCGAILDYTNTHISLYRMNHSLGPAEKCHTVHCRILSRQLAHSLCGYLLLAREMHDTQAHRLTPHTHPAHSPARPADPQIPLTSFLLCRFQGELWRNPPSQDVILSGVSADFLRCGELELRIAKPPSVPSTTLRRFRGCFPTTKLRP